MYSRVRYSSLSPGHIPLVTPEKRGEKVTRSKTNKNALTYNEKKRRALELRAKGWGFQAIADEIGWKSPASAYEAVRKALRDTLQEPADELRILEVERLDKLWKKTMDRMDKDNLWAVDRCLKIMERRAQMLGLDAAGKDGVADEAQKYLDMLETVRKDVQDLSE